jgi:UrcA family protein
MNVIKLLLGAAAVVTSTGAIMLTAGPAHASDVTVLAETDDGVPVARVRFADLDLGAEAGQRLLKRRVASAISQVCRPARDASSATRYNACLTAGWSEANPQLAAVFERAEQIAANGAAARDQAVAVALNSAAIRITPR